MSASSLSLVASGSFIIGVTWRISRRLVAHVRPTSRPLVTCFGRRACWASGAGARLWRRCWSCHRGAESRSCSPRRTPPGAGAVPTAGTFGVVLMVQDVALAKPGDGHPLALRRWLLSSSSSSAIVPTYLSCVLIVLGPIVLGALWLLLQQDALGQAVRAATSIRDSWWARWALRRLPLFTLRRPPRLGAGRPPAAHCSCRGAEPWLHIYPVDRSQQAFVVVVVAAGSVMGRILSGGDGRRRRTSSGSRSLRRSCGSGVPHNGRGADRCQLHGLMGRKPTGSRALAAEPPPLPLRVKINTFSGAVALQRGCRAHPARRQLCVTC